jgi:hypothetical protein
MEVTSRQQYYPYSDGYYSSWGKLVITEDAECGLLEDELASYFPGSVKTSSVIKTISRDI